jgi:hypothetical protein
MPTQEWTQISGNVWTTAPDDEGVYGRVYTENGSDGVQEYWAMTCVDGDVPCDPLETAEVYLSLEDAQDFVEAALFTTSNNAAKPLAI